MVVANLKVKSSKKNLLGRGGCYLPDLEFVVLDISQDLCILGLLNIAKVNPELFMDE
jgi:hypothetical protein